MMRRWHIALTVTALTQAAACTSTSESWPPFVQQHIAQLEAEPKRNPPASIWRYTYRGREVYYVPPYCCDEAGELYDRDGNVICGPDGGLTGEGDGRCRDFFSDRSEERLVWADTR